MKFFEYFKLFIGINEYIKKDIYEDSKQNPIKKHDSVNINYWLYFPSWLPPFGKNQIMTYQINKLAQVVSLRIRQGRSPSASWPCYFDIEAENLWSMVFRKTAAMHFSVLTSNCQGIFIINHMVQQNLKLIYRKSLNIC